MAVCAVLTWGLYRPQQAGSGEVLVGAFGLWLVEKILLADGGRRKGMFSAAESPRQAGRPPLGAEPYPH